MNQEEQPSNLYDFTCEGKGSVYELTWPNLHISCHVENVRGERYREFGELNFESSRPISTGHLRQQDIQLTSGSGKDGVASYLKKCDPEVNWASIVEATCVHVVKQFRAGIPAIQITEEVGGIDSKPIYIVDPLIQEGNVSMIYGEGSSGKSYLALWIAVLADAGISAGGFKVEPSRVLYLDWETEQNEIGNRVRKVRKGLGLSGDSGIWYKRMSQNLASSIQSVQKIADEKGISLLIIDSVAPAAGGEPESAEVSNRFFEALRGMGITAFLIHHTNRENKMFGSIYWYNRTRIMFEVKKDQQSDSNHIVFGLFHRKANNNAIMSNMGFKLTFYEDMVTFDREDVRDTPLAKHLSLPVRVQALLRSGPLTAQQIKEALFDEDTMRPSLNQISVMLSQDKDKPSSQRMFVQTGDKKWGNLDRELVTGGGIEWGTT